ncbi:AGAP009528-PA-like protein [Anopheles sinensis]|uniref:AGAP009528-PA-like protein n=1 Tax=Anopheles sinensis TaxID=74873 RepID=A0A084WGV5_ANOSI|nr:AGAP009528-PA-like protein [Anopheles sinensis]
MSADAERRSGLSILNRRQQINDVLDNGQAVQLTFKVVIFYTGLPKFLWKEIKDYQATFSICDVGSDGYIDLAELKRLMQKLAVAQTHVVLKCMFAEVNEDKDGKISFREFLLIYRIARARELVSDGGEVVVSGMGVHRAKEFFEDRIEQQLCTNKFHDEIRQEREERWRMEEERQLRRQQVQQRPAVFQPPMGRIFGDVIDPVAQPSSNQSVAAEKRGEDRS